MVTTKKQQQEGRGVVPLYRRTAVVVSTRGTGYCTVDTGYSTTVHGTSHTRYEFSTSGLQNRPSPQKNESAHQKRWKLMPNMKKTHIIATVITRRRERSLHIRNWLEIDEEKEWRVNWLVAWGYEGSWCSRKISNKHNGCLTENIFCEVQYATTGNSNKALLYFQSWKVSEVRECFRQKAEYFS